MDDRVPNENPTLLRRSFEMLVSDGGQPRQQIISQLRLDRDDVEELAALPNGFFTDRGEEAQRFGFRLKPAETSSVESDGAEIIDLANRRRG